MNNQSNTTSLINLKEVLYAQIIIMVLMALLAIISYNEFFRIGTLFYAMLLGGLGASISLMNLHKKNVAKANISSRDTILVIAMPVLYGCILSGIAYLFFMSGILSGDGGSGILTTNLFPNFNTSESEGLSLIKKFINTEPYDMQDTGKLMVWSFLAGYSERFVTGILGKLENQTGT